MHHITSHRTQMISIQPPSHQYTRILGFNLKSNFHTIYDIKKNVSVSIHKTMPKHAVSVCDSDDEIQQQHPPKRGRKNMWV